MHCKQLENTYEFECSIFAGRPDQVHNCSLANVSMTSLNVRCFEGFNGGLAQSFYLELRDTHTQEVRFNNTSPVPRFEVPNLHPSAVYQLSVFAFNSKGKSEPYVMGAATLRLPEKQMNSEKGMSKAVEKRYHLI